MGIKHWIFFPHLWYNRKRGDMDRELKVGCETTEGLLNVHPVSETCEVCAPSEIQGEVPKILKHKHYFAPGYQTCDCGAARCVHYEGLPAVPGSGTSALRLQCKLAATASGYCRKHNKIVEAEKEAKRGFWTAVRISDILEHSEATTTLESGKVVKNSLIIYRFLQRMFERQTADEQEQFHTSHDNGVGFAAGDARLLSDIATTSKRFNDNYREKYNHINVDGLTVRQAKYVASRLKKYVHTQLVDIANEATSGEMPAYVSPEAALRRAIAVVATNQPSLGQQMEAGFHEAAQQIEAKVDALKASDPTKYYDPFGEGESLSEEAAHLFWAKRFGANA
jgi:hypothetical protein